MGRSESKDPAMVLNVLIKKEKGLFIAHCLELDIVSTSTNFNQVKKEIVDLVTAQIDYAFSNDNLNYLYHPAPEEVWAEFYACKGQIEEKVEIKSTFKNPIKRFIPPWIIARMCSLERVNKLTLHLKINCYTLGHGYRSMPARKVITNLASSQ